jgi:hypothetical protein
LAEKGDRAIGIPMMLVARRSVSCNAPATSFRRACHGAMGPDRLGIFGAKSPPSRIEEEITAHAYAFA